MNKKLPFGITIKVEISLEQTSLYRSVNIEEEEEKTFTFNQMINELISKINSLKDREILKSDEIEIKYGSVEVKREDIAVKRLNELKKETDQDKIPLIVITETPGGGFF